MHSDFLNLSISDFLKGLQYYSTRIDIAVLEIEPMKEVKPINLSKSLQQMNSSSIVNGFGGFSKHFLLDGFREFEVSLQESKQCYEESLETLRHSNPNVEFFSRKIQKLKQFPYLCTEKSLAATGDSGGPLMQQLSTNEWVLVGICGGRDQIDYYTSVAHMFPWIRGIIENELEEHEYIVQHGYFINWMAILKTFIGAMPYFLFCIYLHWILMVFYWLKQKRKVNEIALATKYKV